MTRVLPFSYFRFILNLLSTDRLSVGTIALQKKTTIPCGISRLHPEKGGFRAHRDLGHIRPPFEARYARKHSSVGPRNALACRGGYPHFIFRKTHLPGGVSDSSRLFCS